MAFLSSVRRIVLSFFRHEQGSRSARGAAGTDATPQQEQKKGELTPRRQKRLEKMKKEDPNIYPLY